MAAARVVVTDEERMEERLNRELKDWISIIQDQDKHLHSLLNTSFQLANYYFVFQGAIFAAISSAKSLTCKDRWFPYTLSILASILNLCALVVSGKKYIKSLRERHESWSSYNKVSVEKERLKRQLPPPRPHQAGSTLGDDCAENKQWTLFVLCVLFFLGFAAVVLVGCRMIVCHRHDNCMCQDDLVNDNPDCIKICVGLKCIKYCH